MNKSKKYPRALHLDKIIKSRTYFLFGPRNTGKSSILAHFFSNSQIFNLLDDDTYHELSQRPKALSEKIKNYKNHIIIDEIQKLPKLLDEVHRLIEKNSAFFILTGSSARKLRREGANMLGGRARELHLGPLTWFEITSLKPSEFNLIKYLNYGGLPFIYLSSEPLEDLKAYVKTYLNEEIKIEAAVRNYDRFVRFLEVMALANAKELNYANLSSDSGVPARTVEAHIEVLKDTLIAFELLPFNKTKLRKAIIRSKFYFFDCGVANYLAQKIPIKENHSDIGDSFEQFIILEIKAYNEYSLKNKNLTYWRSQSKHEVDLIVGQEIAIEIKFSQTFNPEFAKGLIALKEEKLVKDYFVVGRFPGEGLLENGIKYINYELFFNKLWSHQIY